MKKTPARTMVVAFIAILTLCGCSTPSGKPQEAAFNQIWQDYQIQAYNDCLAKIQVQFDKNPTPVQRAILLTTKALCEEEIGHETAARAIYDILEKDFPDTRVAQAARRRLNKKDGDQIERLSLNFNEPNWRRARKQWNDHGVRIMYIPSGQDPTNCTASLDLSSDDRKPSFKFPDDVAAWMEAEFNLAGGTSTRKLLERRMNEDYWEIHNQGPPKSKMFDMQLMRVILTEKRMHIALYTVYKREITESEKTKFLNYLRSAKLFESK